MTTAIRLFPTAILALSLLHSAPKAYAADPLATSDTSLPAASAVLTADAPTARSLPAELFPAALLPSALLPSALPPGALLPEKAASLALPASSSREQSAAEVGKEKQNQARNHAWRNRWLISLAPLVASESFDAASSWGLREMNPVLAGPDGRFGMKATSIKFGVIGGLIGAEYLLKKFPAWAKFFTVVNYATAGVTTGLAVHNYELPGR